MHLYSIPHCLYLVLNTQETSHFYCQWFHIFMGLASVHFQKYWLLSARPWYILITSKTVSFCCLWLLFICSIPIASTNWVHQKTWDFERGKSWFGSIKRHEVFGSIKRHEVVKNGQNSVGSIKRHEYPIFNMMPVKPNMQIVMPIQNFMLPYNSMFSNVQSWGHSRVTLSANNSMFSKRSVMNDKIRSWIGDGKLS